MLFQGLPAHRNLSPQTITSYPPRSGTWVSPVGAISELETFLLATGPERDHKSGDWADDKSLSPTDYEVAIHQLHDVWLLELWQQDVVGSLGFFSFMRSGEFTTVESQPRPAWRFQTLLWDSYNNQSMSLPVKVGSDQLRGEQFYLPV